MARVYNPKTRLAKPVKNLGWLRRHWADVDHFRIVAGGASGRTHMFAILRDGRIFDTPWADAGVLREWIHRPIFRGVRVIWNGEEKVA